MTEDENVPGSSDEPARTEPAGGKRKLENPADLSELAADGPPRTAPLFDNRPAVLKNPAQLPEAGEATDLAEAVFQKVTEDLDWVDKPVPSAEETEARRLRHEAYKKKVRSRRRRRRVLIGIAAAVVLVLLLGAFWFRYTFGGVQHMPDVAGQAGADTPGQNFLIVGDNPRETLPSRSPVGGYRGAFANSDLVMLVHLDRDNRAMYIVSIPRDSAVQIPGHGIGKLSDAYAVGGAALYVRTVEELTGVKLDRVMTLDLAAFSQMADILGGVVVNVPSFVCDEPAGPRRLDGQGALDYIALRTCMPDKDLDRVARQQSLMKAIMRATVDGGTITHPFRINRLVRAGASNTTVEDGYSAFKILGTLWSLRHLSASTTTFLTVPVAAQPISTVKGVTYVRLDQHQDAALWQALRTDTIAEYLQLSGVPVS